MTKRMGLLFLIISLVLMNAAISENSSSQEAFNIIQEAENINLNEAYALLNDYSIYDDNTLALLNEMHDLMKCQGVFIQSKDENTVGKTYTATVQFYYSHGIPYCNVEYTNYAGELSGATVERSDAQEYLFVSRPTGTFFNQEQEFEVLLGEEQVRIKWGGVCDYTLNRSNGDVEKLDDTRPPFVESEAYTNVVSVFDKMFSGMNCAYVYNEATKEFSVYTVIRQDFRSILISHKDQIKDQWQEIIENLAPVTQKIGTAITLATREGFTDVSKATCTVMIVNDLNDQNLHYAQDILCIISNGEILYNILDESLPTENSGNSSVSVGERNALSKAKDYLAIMPFSYEGLIEQLEYEGFSHTEAVYGASNCDADWYAQAAKKATDYLEIFSFSRSGLIEQLEYEGFTHDQAVYGAEQNGY